MYLGIDIGTSSVKTVLFDRAQRLVAQASAALDISRPHPGWSEQDPEAWWRAVTETIDRIAAETSLADLRGIGLSGQMHGAVCLDHDDRVMRPAILWNDGRASAECAELEQAFPRAREISGNIAMPGFTAPKLLWLRHHEPEIFEHVSTVLLPKDYIRFCLTGHHVSEMSDASGTLWLDVAERDWSDDLLEATGLTRAHMPRLVEGSEASGALRLELAQRWGVKGEVVVAGGAGDNAAAACGVGVVRPGTAFVSLGTSGVLFVSNARFSPNTQGAVHAFCHALPATWHQMGVILSAADSLEWLARLVGRRASVLAGEIGTVERPSPVTFLPYLSGERTPHNDAAARGAFIGLSQSNGATDLAQAVMEGVAYAMADCQEALAAGGTDFESALAVGGGARSHTWLRILASVLNRPLEIPSDGDVGAAAGAARLAICAAEGAAPHEVCTAPEIDAVIEPLPALVGPYQDGLARYRALYPALKALPS
ncbi:xylulokinase [Rhodobacteraceae bacterium DSL-40]|uniref:xylulokinase n=1 Tax=Amaricoccus sp. B4 TaxID=3368557 RepID=UPI000DAE0493